MTVNSANKTGEETLNLRSQMADLALVPRWIERLSAEHAIPPSTEFAMNLCLEEVLSNIIRHGYGNKPDLPIVIHYRTGPDNSCLLVVEDEAPTFNPLAVEETSVEETLGSERIGGLGLRLLRSFATTLRYEPTPSGNRLSIGFSAIP